MTNVVPIRPTEPPSIEELIEAMRETQIAIEEARIELGAILPLCLGLAHERNRRLLERMEAR